MALAWPTMTNSKCTALTLCGEVGERDESAPAGFVHDESWLIANYVRDGQEIFVRFGRTTKKKAGTHHFHLDISPAGAFAKGPPKANSDMAEIERAIDPLSGLPYQAKLTGSYRLTRPELPEVMKSLMVKTSSDGVEVELTGATLTVKREGMPIQKIQWEASQKSDTVFVTSELTISTTIKPSLLEESLNLLEAAYASFFERGVAHD